MFNTILAVAGLLVIDRGGSDVQRTIGATLFGVGLNRAINNAIGRT